MYSVQLCGPFHVCAHVHMCACVRVCCCSPHCLLLISYQDYHKLCLSSRESLISYQDHHLLCVAAARAISTTSACGVTSGSRKPAQPAALLRTAARAQARQKPPHHARRTPGIRMALSTTEWPAWHCGDHTATVFLNRLFLVAVARCRGPSLPLNHTATLPSRRSSWKSSHPRRALSFAPRARDCPCKYGIGITLPIFSRS